MMNEQRKESEFNKKMIDLVFEECKYINDVFGELFARYHLLLNEASIEEITFYCPDFSLVFCYYPDRYEYGEIMLNKGVKLQLGNDGTRRYSIKDIALYLGKTEGVEIERRDRSLSPLQHQKLIIEDYLTEILDSKDFSWEEGLKQQLDKRSFFR